MPELFKKLVKNKSIERSGNLAAGVDLEDFEKFYKTWYRKLFRFFLNQGIQADEEIRELIQITFIKVYKNKEQVKHRDNISPWIFTIARNTMKDWFKKMGREKKRRVERDDLENSSDNLDNMPSDVNIFEETAQKEFIEIVKGAVLQLPSRMRQCLLLQIEGEYSYEEIASALRVSPETVKSQLFHARKRLKEQLSELLDEIEF